MPNSTQASTKEDIVTTIQSLLSPEEAAILTPVLHAKPVFVEGTDITKETKPFAQGNYGAVYKAKARVPYASYVVKTAHNTPKAKQDLYKELAMMGKFSKNTPYVIQLSGIYFSGSHLGILMPHMSGGDLHHFLRSAKGASLSGYNRLELAHQIICGLMSIHNELKMVHRDLRPANILINVQSVFTHAVIADLGAARDLADDGSYKETANYVATTHPYCPPSLLEKDLICKRQNTEQEFDYSPKTDTFSLAFIFYALLAGKFHTADQKYSNEYVRIQNIISNDTRTIERMRESLRSANPSEKKPIEDGIRHLEKEKQNAQLLLNNLPYDPEKIEAMYIRAFDQNRADDTTVINQNRSLAPALAKAIEMSWGKTKAERSSLTEIKDTIILGLRAQAPRPSTSASPS